VNCSAQIPPITITSTQANEYTTQLAWWHNTLPDLSTAREVASRSNFTGSDVQRRISVLRRTHLYMHESLRILSILLQPFMPSKSSEALDILGVDGNHRDWSDAVLGWELRIERESDLYNLQRGVLFPPLNIRNERMQSLRV
jgi:hypothetical protein